MAALELPPPDTLLAWLLTALLLLLPLLRGPGGSILAALCRTSAPGLVITAHWSPPSWYEALVACGLDPRVGSHQRLAMRRVAGGLLGWHVAGLDLAGSSSYYCCHSYMCQKI